MKWQIKLGIENKLVDLPDSIASGRVFFANIGEKRFECCWHAPSKTLTVKTEAGSVNLSNRTALKQRFPGEMETSLQAEAWNPKSQKMECLSLSAALHAPGQENRASQNKAGSGIVRSPMTGKVIALLVAVGDKVEAGQQLAVVEAMKMENKIIAPISGIIEKISLAVGAPVTAGQELFRLSQ